MDLIAKINALQTKVLKHPQFKAGDTVQVHMKVKEGEKERVQKFKGIVTGIRGNGTNKSFTVRKMSFGVGVERSFPFSCPNLSEIELIAQGKVRRSRLYYLRGLIGKKARISSELYTAEAESAD